MSTYEERLEIGKSVNEKLKNFAEEQLTLEEKQALNAVLALAENVILKKNIVLPEQNEKDLTKLREKLIEQRCDEDPLLLPEGSSTVGTLGQMPTVLTGVTITYTIGDKWQWG